MEFTMYYRGKLTAQGNTLEKHNLRRYFHGQLKELWSHPPLSQHFDLIDPDFEPPNSKGGFVTIGGDEPEPSVITKVGAYSFTSIVSSEIDLVANLSITFLRPEPPGYLRDKNGDLDNRIKTLLDGLKVPNAKNAIRMDESLEYPDPLYCLLEDDSLITSLTIKSDRLLEPGVLDDLVVLLIHVRTRPTIGTHYNLGLM